MPVAETIHLKDSHDFYRSGRLVSDDGPDAVDSGRFVIRSAEEADPPLIEVAATLSGPPTHWATVVVPMAMIAAVDFEGLVEPAVWEFVVVRSDDGLVIPMGFGTVRWSKGTAW